MSLLITAMLFLTASVLTAVACLHLSGNIDRYEEQQLQEKTEGREMK